MRPYALAPLLLFVILKATPVIAREAVEGFTEPYRTVDISVGEPGIVTEISVQPGETVEAGAALLRLDTSVLDATLAIATQRSRNTGSVDAAKAELQLRTERLEQITLLRQRGHATQRELSRAQTDLDIATARLRLAEEEQVLNQLDCKRIEAQIARRSVTSPVHGVIAEVHREVGESLLVTDPRIMTLVQLDKLRTRFAATPNQAAKLQVQQRVRVSFVDSGQMLTGTVQRISPVVDAKSGTLEVHVVIDNARNELRSGARCLLDLDATSKSANTMAHTSARSR